MYRLTRPEGRAQRVGDNPLVGSSPDSLQRESRAGHSDQSGIEDGMPCTSMILLFATVAAASTVPAQLDAILKDYGGADAPGASVLVAQGGKVLYRKAFGLANLEQRTPITT